jgi:formate hydrogenlyase subunit 3/multisubunit Na+/H+ antiporter MnhD subunit
MNLTRTSPSKLSLIFLWNECCKINSEVEAIFSGLHRKGGNMKNLYKTLELLALLCIIGAFVLTALNAFGVLAASFGFQRPFNYFQYMRVPYWGVALPAAGILSMLPLALRLAFMRETAEEKMKPAATVDLRRTIEGLRGKFRLRPV